MSDRQVQVNIRLAESSADRLKRFAESAGLKIGAFVERLIAAYSNDSNLLQNDSKPVLWQSVADDLRGLIDSQDVRLNALEMAVMTGLCDREGRIAVRIETPDFEPVEADSDSPSHQAESLPLPPQQFNQDKDQFRAEAVKLYRQWETNSAEILRILTKQGYCNSEGKGYYRNDVAKAIKRAKAAGLVE